MGRGSISLKIDGLKPLQRQMKALPKNMRTRAYRYAIAAAARQLRNDVKKLAPRRSGNLKKAIKARYKVNAREHYGGIQIERKAYYWFFQEFGTSRHRAQPFLYDTFKSSANGIVKRYIFAINKVLSKP